MNRHVGNLAYRDQRGVHQVMVGAVLLIFSVLYFSGCVPTPIYYEATASLNGAEVVPIPELRSSATGHASFSVDQSSRAITGSVTLIGVAATKVTLNIGNTLENGAEVANLNLSSGNTWVVAAGETLSASENTSLLQNKMYVIAFSSLYPSGEVRGQVMSPKFKENADDWNNIFEKDPGTAYGWSGGDADMSTPLPYCSACPEGQRQRDLWLFGDSVISTVDSTGRRTVNGARGADGAFGNTAAVTYRGDNDPSPVSVTFDWNASGVVDAPSWMPLLLNPDDLGYMDPLRLSTRGYSSMGFINNGEVFRVYPNKGSAPVDIQSDVVPVYEYYSALFTSSSYVLDKTPDEYGFAYQRIAFYVHSTNRAGTVPLYRYFSSAFSDFLLSTSPSVEAATGGIYSDRQPLGYVFPPSATNAGSVPVTQYFNYSSASYDAHHVYTHMPNDFGQPVVMWPLRGVVIGNDLIHVFSPVNFIESSDGANWSVVERNVATILRGVDRPYSQWGKTSNGSWTVAPEQHAILNTTPTTRWGLLLLKDDNFASNKYVYIYGVRDGKLLVARVVCQTADDFVNFESWQYYSNGSWVTSQVDATPIMNDYVGPDFTIHKSPSGRYILAESAVWFAPGIYFYKSPSLTGPFVFSQEYDLGNYAEEAGDTSKYLYYAGNAHEGLSYNGGGAKGGLLISYVRVCLDGSSYCQGTDSDAYKTSLYVPRFVNLPWSMIDP